MSYPIQFHSLASEEAIQGSEEHTVFKTMRSDWRSPENKELENN